MVNDRRDGIGHQVKGAMMRAVGKLIGDSKLASDGAAEIASGAAQVAADPNAGRLMGIDSDRIKGVAHQLEGTMKETIGHIISDPGLRHAGVAERAAGRAQNAAGGARDTARDMVGKGE